MLPRGHHATHRLALVFKLDRLAYQRILMRYLLNIALPKQHPRMAVLFTVWIDGAPQQH